MKINMRKLVVIATIGTLSLLLALNKSEYSRYKAINQKDITALNNNIVTLESTKTKTVKSLEDTIANLKLQNLKLNTTMVDSLKNLKEENERLKASLGIKKIAYLRPHDSIDYLPLHYGAKVHPSIGYMGNIKTTDFEDNEYTKVKVIEVKDQWTKISIDSYIPNWYIVDKENGEFKQQDIIHSIIRKKMYTNVKCIMKLSPSKDSLTQSSLEKGKAVYVTKEYEDWYFIELQQTYNDNNFTKGWVKKSQLGTKKSTEPLEAIIKRGTLVMEYYDTEEREERILNYDIPVYILKEKNIGEFIYGRATDSWGFWIHKRDIDFDYISSK